MEEEITKNNSTVNQPDKLIRIASMTRAMLEEVRRAPIDETGRNLLIEVHERSLNELKEIISDDLKEELETIFLPLKDEQISESAVRIAQAQLVGWLEGLFHGIQASLFSQEALARAKFAEMRTQAIEAKSSDDQEERPGQYL
ncbi:MAG: DUF2587 domain-containing protein [Actinomycetota bacterium]|nr:DUF2587 domain-containing protein [Actinomycetota bacterium]MDA3013537.1 DUF2587 domain-containing protein [Actinomycetota bacterium]